MGGWESLPYPSQRGMGGVPRGLSRVVFPRKGFTNVHGDLVLMAARHPPLFLQGPQGLQGRRGPPGPRGVQVSRCCPGTELTMSLRCGSPHLCTC